jgi:hypothetical protein
VFSTRLAKYLRLLLRLLRLRLLLLHCCQPANKDDVVWKPYDPSR